MALGLGIGAEDPEAPVGPHRSRRPDLLPVEDPLGAVVAQHAGRADGGEVGAGVRLAPGLRPHDLARRHGGEEPRLLLVGADLHDRGAEQEDAVLVHPARRAGAVVLLLEDQPVEVVGAAAAVLLRPRHRRPAALPERALPLAVEREAGLGVEARQWLGGTLASSQARASARNASWSGVYRRSIGPQPYSDLTERQKAAHPRTSVSWLSYAGGTDGCSAPGSGEAGQPARCAAGAFSGPSSRMARSRSRASRSASVPRIGSRNPV